MRWTLPLFAAMVAPSALAADHSDGPAASKDPTADITDLFAWQVAKTGSTAAKTYLVLDLGTNVATTEKFSDSVKYVFHTMSEAKYGATTKTPLDIICTFTTAQAISCWVGPKLVVTGDASKTTGLASSDGKVKVYAGVRDDPFFFNLTGFKDVTTLVHDTATSNTPPAFEDGCPILSSETSNTLVAALKGPTEGGVAPNDFAGFNVLSIVMELDTTLVTAGGPILGVWASTNK
ncbi:MAG TPA: DUF4331 family protein [Polyangiaceae bacterium]|jgi:hypothetical protein|nr:DUF4331 family protein [Polyangiaceae bacterium]